MATGRAAADSSDFERDDTAYDDYLADINDACGCTEIWEYLSERRRQKSASRD